MVAIEFDDRRRETLAQRARVRYGWVGAAVVAVEKTLPASRAWRSRRRSSSGAGAAAASLGDERGLILRLRATLLATEDLLRTVDLNGLSVDGFVDAATPTSHSSLPDSGAGPPRSRTGAPQARRA